MLDNIIWQPQKGKKELQNIINFLLVTSPTEDDYSYYVLKCICVIQCSQLHE